MTEAKAPPKPVSKPAPSAVPKPAQASPPKPAAKPAPAASGPDLAKLRKRVVFQSYVIAALVAVLFVMLPFAKPAYVYYGLESEDRGRVLVGLDVPNMTNQALLSWASASVTEILTFGFGDLNVKLPKQQSRFTKEGWDAFVKGFLQQKIGETFRQSQLVLTTVPSNTPVITAQGINLKKQYEWIVQIPLIMTYATNNNVARKERGVITLRIVRVPATENPAGLAIKGWYL